MANKILGVCECPICKSEFLQEVRESEKSGKPYINCDDCGVQIFARTPASVKIIRNMAKPSPGQKPDNLSIPAKPEEVKPETSKSEPEKPAPVKEKNPFSIFG